MKNAHKYSLLILLSLFVLASCSAQTSPAGNFSVAGGKWIVCADTTLKKGVECTNPYSGFEFMQNGTYKEYPRTVTDQKRPILTGKWMMENNVFIIDQDDVPGTLELPKTYTITWIDKDHFFSNNKSGEAGPEMYVYFQRMQ